MALPIEDYALIGDRHTAALVGKDGSIDWLCLPRFDSSACFAALLGTPDHGRWLLAPLGDYEVSRRYLDGSTVLETTFTTETGTVVLVDLIDRKSTRLNSSHSSISYAVFCLKKKKKTKTTSQSPTNSHRDTREHLTT